MRLRYNFRMYPTPGQCVTFARAFGCARVVFNDALAARKQAHREGLPYPTSGVLSKTLITAAKRTPQRSWLAHAPVGVLQQSLRDLHQAFKNYFDSVKGKRKGPKIAPPRFKSRKDNRQAIRYTRSDRFKVLDNGCLRLPRVGQVKVRWSRQLPAIPSSVTVTKEASGRYFCSFVVETSREPLPGTVTDTGIDLGLTHFAVLADGRKITAPRFLRRAERKLNRLQQALSRKTKGSANRAKARVKVAQQHGKVTDKRRDWHHKVSTRVIRDNQAVYVEDLAVNGLGRTRLAKSVHDAGWSAFVNMLEYKATLYGRYFAKIGRFEPTSQICSGCGVKDGPKPLSIRMWTCRACGDEHDRDVNAAKNILAAGQADRLNACGAQIGPRAVSAPRRETGTHRSAEGTGSMARCNGAVGTPVL